MTETGSGINAEQSLVESHGIVAVGQSSCGPVRPENQDRFAALRSLSGDIVLVIADGMGGQEGGGDAAEAAVRAAARTLIGSGVPLQVVGAAVAAADHAVGAVRDRLGGRPGTTLVIAWASRSRAILANLGDSRAYHLREGVAIPVTADHSWVAEQIRAGALPEQAAREDHRRNIVTRAVLGDGMTADITEVELRPGDLLLLCTDGVWEPLSDEDMAAIIVDEGPLPQRVGWLVQAAIDAGSRDNATVVAAEISS